MTAVADGKSRVENGFDGVISNGASPYLVDAIKSDLKKSEEHLKEAMSIHGVDSEIYIHLYEARTAIEEAALCLYHVAAEGPSKKILGRLASALDSLTEIHNTKN